MSGPVQRRQPAGRVRPWRAFASLGVALEAAALAAGGLWALGLVVRGAADSVAVDLTLAGFALVLAVLLAMATVAVRRGRERVRGPVLTWQLLQAATAGALIGGATDATPLVVRFAGWATALLAVLVVAALLVDVARRDG